jgi:DNA-3-methyladenine glycosylase
LATSLHSGKKVRIRRLTRAELPTDTVELARFLVGKIVVHELPGGRVSGRIVETEAYPPGDPAGHHFRGPTPRIRSMYLAPGHAYVYFNYGAHFMLNVSGEPEGTAGGILIRAVEPLEGVELMKFNRNCETLEELTRGPGRLAAAFQIDRRHDGLDLCAPGPLWLGQIIPAERRPTLDTVAPSAVIGETVRIGISRAADKVLRFYEPGNAFVSGPKRLLASFLKAGVAKTAAATDTCVPARKRTAKRKTKPPRANLSSATGQD